MTYLARRDAINRRNIKAGWKATGLWPIDVTIPLDNPMLPGSRKFNQDRAEEPRPVTPVDQDADPMFETPTAGADVRRQLLISGLQATHGVVCLALIELGHDIDWSRALIWMVFGVLFVAGRIEVPQI